MHQFMCSHIRIEAKNHPLFLAEKSKTIWAFGPFLYHTNHFPSRLRFALVAHDAVCIFPLSNVHLKRVGYHSKHLSLSQSAVPSDQGLV